MNIFIKWRSQGIYNCYSAWEKLNIGEVLQGAQATPGTTQAYMQISSLLLKSGVTATEKSSLAGGLQIL